MERGRAGIMRLMYTNCQSVINKRDELRAYVSEVKPDFILLTECWTNNGIDNSLLKIVNYDMIMRKDRLDTDRGRGGGLLGYVKKGICAWETDAETEFCQVGGIEIKTMGGRVLKLFVIYRSPNSSAENDADLNNWIERQSGEFVMCGDFNYPGIDWENNVGDSKSRDFVDTLENKFLWQHVEGGTHNSGNLLDLILSSSQNLVGEVVRGGRLGGSDHDILLCSIMWEGASRRLNKRRRDFKRANFEMIRSGLDVNWETRLDGLSVEDTWLTIRERLHGLIDQHIPWKEIKGRNRPPWMSEKIIKAIDKKKRLYARRNNGPENMRAYKKSVKELKKMVNNAKKGLEKKIAKEGKTNKKLFYSYLKSERGNKVKVGPLKREDGSLVTEPKDMANALNKWYSKVFTVDDGSPAPAKPKLVQNGQELTKIDYTVQRVRQKIDKLRDGAAPGIDGVTPRILKETKDQLSVPLSILYNRSIREKTIPSEWRDSVVVPIYKGGSKFVPANYRPVNLTLIVMKIMEMVTGDELDEHAKKYDLIKNSQHGFRSGRSCLTNLIEFQNQLTQWIDQGMPCDVVFLDFAKAFDKVDHGRLKAKLEAFGIAGDLLGWLADWLSNRRQKVVVDGAESDWERVVSSVVQGSSLGAKLFIIFIDDIDDFCGTLVRKFADDTKGAMVVQNESQAREFQNMIDRFVKWAKDWRMTFNIEKCKIMHLGRGNPQSIYHMEGTVLKTTDVEKDLGVWMSETLKPSVQCKKAATKANQTLGQISRAFHYRNKEVFGKLIKMFVRPQLEYAASVWAPWTEANCELLEGVQRRAIRMMSNVKGRNYEEKLKDAGFMLLKERRLRGDMIETYKVMKGISQVNIEDWFQMVGEERRPTRQNALIGENGNVEWQEYVIQGERYRLEIRKNFFNVRVTKVWNSLPTNVKNASNVNAFKNRIDTYMKNHKLGELL